MGVMKRGVRRRVVSVAVFVGLLVLAGLLFTVALKDPSPLRAGATPDEVWVFISTNRPSQGVFHGVLPITKRTMWSADSQRIESETRFRWRTNKLIAVRKTLYSYHTDGTIKRVTSDLQWHR